jgi:predicted flap endonuclease-1-like 5' DNA nuclease
MGFLLAKILILLAVAALGGGLFAYWWFRRHYEDITLEYTRSRDEWSNWRRSFEERLAARPAVDLHPLSQQLAGVDAAVRAINIPQPQATDLSPVLSAVSDIRMPTPERVDLAPLHARLEAIEQRISSLRIPDAPAAVDLTPVLERLAAMQTRLENPPAPSAPPVAIREGSRNLLSHAGLGKPDDLKQIKGVKRVLERKLHKVGVFYFWQIADWSQEDVAHVDSVLPAFKGRIERDHWVTQASELSAQPTAAKPPEQH